MEQKYGVCKICNEPHPVNSKGICPSCIYKQNHGGLDQSEVYLNRFLTKIKTQPIKVYSVKKQPVRTRKKTVVNGLLKDERLEKRREQIRKDEETYEEVFKNNPNECEECGTQLPDIFRDENEQVVARWQYSHILGKGAFPEFRNDPRNFQRLCLNCHQTWEFGDRVEMKTYSKNQETVQTLRDEENKRREIQSLS